MKNHYLFASSALLLSASAFAQIAIDGTAEAAYGVPAGIQSVGTDFANSTDALRGTCNGSEIDAIYGKVDAAGGYLYLVIAGNLQSNFNKLEIFIDSKPGGQNALRSDNANVDYNGLNRMGPDPVNALPGLKFDAGFEPDLYFTCTGGNAPYTLYANFAQLLTDGGGVGEYIGSSVTDATTGNILIDDATFGLQAAMDNSNVAGVDSLGGASSSGAGVTTGLELRIPLISILGWDGISPIKVCAFVNGGGHDYASNQFIGALPDGQGNLGGDGSGVYLGGDTAALRFDLANFAGNQFVTIGGGTPPPTCPADLDGDNFVGGSDLGNLLGAWGVCGAVCPADFDGDGVVSGSDLGKMLGDWGACPG
jgi:hypothetical protein